MTSTESTKPTESSPAILYSFSICGLQNRTARLGNTSPSSNTDIESLVTKVSWPLNEDKNNTTVGTLKSRIQEELNVSSSCEMKVLYGGVELEKDTDALSLYVLEPEREMLFEPYIVAALKEGKSVKSEVVIPETKAEETKENPEPATTATVVSTETEIKAGTIKTVEERFEMYNAFAIKQIKAKDPVLLDECDDCYVLPQCGHGICGDSLFHYAWDCAINKKLSTLTCPHIIESSPPTDTATATTTATDTATATATATVTVTAPTTATVTAVVCGVSIPFTIVKRILSHYFEKQEASKLKDARQQIAALQIMLCENFLHEHYDVQKCGRCNSILCRDLKADRTANVQFKSLCPVCTGDKEWQRQKSKENEKENAKEEIQQCLTVKKEDKHGNQDKSADVNVDVTNTGENSVTGIKNEEEKEEVKTPVEKESNPSDHLFCWSCQNEWKDATSEFCGNEQCQTLTRAQVISFLSTCETKTIGEVEDVPEIRGCPTCGQMVNHTEACKHMACRCTAAFCFVCMKPKLKNGNWQCGGSSDVCPVYKRQTHEDLPAGNRSVVKLFSLIDKK